MAREQHCLFMSILGLWRAKRRRDLEFARERDRVSEWRRIMCVQACGCDRDKVGQSIVIRGPFRCVPGEDGGVNSDWDGKLGANS